MKHKSLGAGIALMVILALLTACSPTGTASIADVGHNVVAEGGAYTEISAQELHSLLGSKNLLLVNTHIPFEGDIPGTDLSIPYDQIDQHLSELPNDKDIAIVLYCRSGRMSTIASETLIGLGYTNVFNVDGGMVAWEQAGYRINR